jgi:F-type H+-transporting ATPase subunit epsilon
MADTIKVDVVTAERVVYSEDVDIVVAPGVAGELGILPHHAPLMTMLEPGELRLKQGFEEILIAISGGFLEVQPDKVIVLAESAERDIEIDMARAEEAMRRAKERLARRVPGVDVDAAEAALRRSIARVKVGEKRRRKTLRI